MHTVERTWIQIEVPVATANLVMSTLRVPFGGKVSIPNRFDDATAVAHARAHTQSQRQLGSNPILLSPTVRAQ